ncbi:MAG: ABC transporter substrate-binding protein [Alphaproteobacteria bacterium]
MGLTGFGQIETTDPARAMTPAPILVTLQVYERLTGLDADGLPIPSLARTWEHSRDLREWKFDLRPGVRFHSLGQAAPGRLLTPNDVKASLDRAARMPGYPQGVLVGLVEGAAEVAAGRTRSINGISTSDSSVTFTLTRPFRFLPEHLAASFFGTVPDDTSTEVGAALLGTGPYHLMEWNPRTGRVLLGRFEGYWGDASPDAPSRIEVIPIESQGVAVEELRTGNIDWLEAPLIASRALQAAAVATPRLTVETVPSSTIRFLAANAKREPFASNPTLLRALNLGTDRPALVATLGGGVPLEGPLPSSPGLPFDPGAARRLVSALPGAARRFDVLVEPSPESRILAQALHAQWATLGIDIRLQAGLPDWVDRLVSGDFTAASIFFGPFAATDEQYLWMYDSRGQPVPNLMRYENSAFDDAYRTYVSLPGSDTHREQAVRELLARPPVVWLLGVPSVTASAGRIRIPRAQMNPAFQLARVS